MPLIALVAMVSFATRSVIGQDPNDPLLYAPKMRVGARLQMGMNVYPENWSYTGRFAEPTDSQKPIPGWHFLSLIPREPDHAKELDPLDRFLPVPCEFLGSTIIVNVFSQDGKKHRFSIDSGAVNSYIQPRLAYELQGRLDGSVPFCFQIPDRTWVHFPAQVDRSIAVLESPTPEFPIEGIMGMDALRCLQLKIDYRSRKLWARIPQSDWPIERFSSELMGKHSLAARRPVVLPLNESPSGRLTVEISVNGAAVPVEIDTGASIIGLTTQSTQHMDLERIGTTRVLIQAGSSSLDRLLAKEAHIGPIPLLWPVIHHGSDPRIEFGGMGPSLFPAHSVILDYPGRRLVTAAPTDKELLEQAIGQFLSGTVTLEQDKLLLALPESIGSGQAVIVKVLDIPTPQFLHLFRLLLKGEGPSRAELTRIYRRVVAGGHLTIVHDGHETILELGA